MGELILPVLGFVVWAAAAILNYGELLYFFIGVYGLIKNDFQFIGRKLPLFSKLILYNLIAGVVSLLLTIPSEPVLFFNWSISYKLLLACIYIPRLLGLYFVWHFYKLAQEERWEEAGKIFQMYAVIYFFTRLTNELFNLAIQMP